MTTHHAEEGCIRYLVDGFAVGLCYVFDHLILPWPGTTVVWVPPGGTVPGDMDSRLSAEVHKGLVSVPAVDFHLQEEICQLSDATSLAERSALPQRHVNSELNVRQLEKYLGNRPI